MDLCERELVVLMFNLRAQKARREVDELSEAIAGLATQCDTPAFYNQRIKYIIQECLKHEIPENLRIRFERILAI